ncbi:hypothetical protein [Citricoccus sp. GCM10030269]|uniref:hypothetical protein n=1 Tax=Citricoccus sp. GCM10030269 TaxID=3273388 RepID=UPI0036137108
MPKTATRRTISTRPFRVIGLSAAGAITALAVSSCGSSVPALEDVWPDVSASIENASSVAIDGSVTQGGQDVSVKIAGQIDDSSYSGTVSMDESDVEVVGNQEYTYMKPNAAFYEQLGGAQLQDMVGEKWLEMPAERGGFTMSTFWDSFSDDIPGTEEFGDSEYTSEAVDLNGEEVYKYTGTQADSEEPVSVYVSKDNKLMRIEAENAGAGSDDASSASSDSPSASASDEPTGTGAGTVNFSRWDAVEPVDMPAEDEIFSIPGM